MSFRLAERGDQDGFDGVQPVLGLDLGMHAERHRRPLVSGQQTPPDKPTRGVALVPTPAEGEYSTLSDLSRFVRTNL